MKCNSGVKCNVFECVYNKQGCECAMETIEVSRGQNLQEGEKAFESPHFCKTYKKR